MTEPDGKGRKEYDYGTRTLAEQLYIYRGRTYEEVARETGVSHVQLERWGSAGEWRGKRDQYLKSKSEAVTRLIGIRDRILDNVEAEIQPNTVHQLLAGYRQVDSIIEGKLSGASAEMDRPKAFLEDVEFIAQVLREADPEGLKVFARSLDLIVERGKARFGAQAGGV